MIPDEFTDVLREQLQRQPWYERFSNTLTAAIGAAVLIIWLLASSGVEVPQAVHNWVAVAIATATVLGVRVTKNGLTPRTVEAIEQYTGKHRR